MGRSDDSGSDAPTWQHRKETLAERSERVIGKPLIPEGATPDSKPTKGRKDSSTNARRQQVLQAQRNHRLRTQQYIRELEKEVFRLRDIEKDLLARVASLSAELDRWRVPRDPSPAQSNFSISTGLTSHGQPSSSVGFQNFRATIHVDLTALQNTIPIGSCKVDTISGPPSEYMTPPSQPDYSEQSDEVMLADMSTQAALDFVLYLEQPCLPHVKHAHIQAAREPPSLDIEGNSGPHHLLTLSAGIIREQQTRHSDDEIQRAPFQMSESSIDRLFELSLTLPLTGEVTPVQIWDRLKSLATRFAITEKRLTRIREEFIKYVRCNSFGAVVPTDIADKIFVHEFSIPTGFGSLFC